MTLSEYVRPDMKLLHDERRAAGVCIYGESHGPSVTGGRCASCWERKKLSDKRRTMARRRSTHGA